jgi:hypothetical protein
LYVGPEIRHIIRVRPFVGWVTLEMAFLAHGHESGLRELKTNINCHQIRKKLATMISIPKLRTLSFPPYV